MQRNVATRGALSFSQAFAVYLLLLALGLIGLVVGVLTSKHPASSSARAEISAPKDLSPWMSRDYVAPKSDATAPKSNHQAGERNVFEPLLSLLGSPTKGDPAKNEPAKAPVPPPVEKAVSPVAAAQAPPEDEALDEAMAEYEAAKAEYHAAEKLRLARRLKVLSDDLQGSEQRAVQLAHDIERWYQSIVRYYPETQAAKDAKRLLAGERVGERPMPPLPKLPKGVEARTDDLADAIVKKEVKSRTAVDHRGSVEAYAGPAGVYSSGGQKTVHVRSYTRKDGTVVRAHTRSAPKSGGGRSSHRGSSGGRRR